MAQQPVCINKTVCQTCLDRYEAVNQCFMECCGENRAGRTESQGLELPISNIDSRDHVTSDTVCGSPDNLENYSEAGISFNK